MDGIANSMDMNLSRLREMVKDSEAFLACYTPWSHKESDTTEQLNNNIVLLQGISSRVRGLW